MSEPIELKPVSGAAWTSADILPLLEHAMQLETAQGNCDCDRSEVNVCSGYCVSGQIWRAIYRARKLIRAALPSDAGVEKV